MNKKICTLSLLALGLAPATVFASGYRIPEQSFNSVALSAAYVANTDGADTSYYNPANMDDLADGWHGDLNLTYIGLTSIDYTINPLTPNPLNSNGSSRSEQFLLPQMHLVSPKYDKLRFGLSLTYPAGLTKRWDSSYQKMFAEEFALTVYELSPSASYRFNDKASLAIGFRILYADGTVKNDLSLASPGTTRDMEGDTTEFGYNLALTVKPADKLKLSATYRSKVDLDIEGDALITAGGSPIYNGNAYVSVPVPAVLDLAAAYTMNKTTIELVYEKTYWSAYEQLDFNYDTTIPIGSFENPVAKNWSNSNTYRIGITHEISERFKLLAGFAIDETPIPDSSLSFELPDSDAKVYSIGGKLKHSEALELGLAYLYSDKEERTVQNAAVDGTFTNTAAHLVTLSAQYRF